MRNWIVARIQIVLSGSQIQEIGPKPVLLFTACGVFFGGGALLFFFRTFDTEADRPWLEVEQKGSLYRRCHSKTINLIK